MSSLAAVQADGYYNPPEWDPRKGSLKKFTGAKGHNQYLQSGIIRFELPYNSWCLSCNAHIGKVRTRGHHMNNTIVEGWPT